jgi:hypothetical protein
VEYGSADKDLLTEDVKPGQETLPSDQDDGQNELDNQNGLFNSTAPAKSFSSAGIPAPSLLSAALQVPAGQIVVPAAVDPTQGSALSALQVLKVIFMHLESHCSIFFLEKSFFVLFFQHWLSVLVIVELFLQYVDGSIIL